VDTKSGCGRLDLSAFLAEAARPAWPILSDDAPRGEDRTWRPAELERSGLAPLFESRPN
jgi:hypothetical protein